MYIIAANGRSKTAAGIGIGPQCGGGYTKLTQFVRCSIPNGDLFFSQRMGPDFNGSCAGIRIRPHGDGFRQILLRMVVIMDVHAEEPLIDLFPEGKHGFLGPAADKDFGIFADSDICPIISRTDIILNLNTITFDNILVCSFSHTKHA